jgi:hypothetical protein
VNLSHSVSAYVWPWTCLTTLFPLLSHVLLCCMISGQLLWSV